MHNAMNQKQSQLYLGFAVGMMDSWGLKSPMRRLSHSLAPGQCVLPTQLLPIRCRRITIQNMCEPRAQKTAEVHGDLMVNRDSAK